MDYYKILHFNREPFSNSPDPGFFYKSAQHLECLQKLEIALRLRRGLSILLGEVGTGKTTLCRRLISAFNGDDTAEAHLIFDPCFGTPVELLSTVARMFKCAPTEQDADEWQLKECIKNHLFTKGVGDGKTVILIIDEGQKIPPFCLEILREFLNYETNEAKLLQIVIFAQTEFEATLKGLPNFSDRVNLLLRLRPLPFKDARQMIAFRLDKASERGKSGIRFTWPASLAIYRATGGYPRKIVHLCHQIILALILQNRAKAGLSLARSCIQREGFRGRSYLRWAFVAAFVPAVAFWAVLEHGSGSRQKASPSLTRVPIVAVTVEKAPDPKKAEEPGPISGPPLALAAQPAENPTRSAPAAEASPGPPPAETPAPAFPSEIGRIAVRRNDVLSAMVARVYGEFTAERMLKVAGANPRITDINQIPVGRIIAFPVLGAKSADQVWKGCVIRLSEAKSLEDAYRFIQASPKAELPWRLLSTWNRETGVSFHVVAPQRYKDEASARTSLAMLPPELSVRADILQGFSPGTMILTPWQ